MPYVVMQKGLEPPRVEQLKAAFRGIPGLTPMDAPIMCKDAFGILVRGFEEGPANQLQAALAAQGVEVEVVDQVALPVLPPMRHVTRVECTPDALTIYDPLGNGFPLAWNNILLIAAGKVMVVEFTRKSTPPIMPDQGGGLGVIDDLLFRNSGLPLQRNSRMPYPEANYHTTEEHNERWTVEIIIKGAGLRYNMEGEAAGQLLFKYLGERQTEDMAVNFKLLVQDLCRFAPETAINRGAYYLREDHAAAFKYPSKNAFYEEMVWLLWRLKG
jgi:hypothetical protein